MISNIIHVSRPNPGQGAWLPSDVSGLALWLDASDESTITKTGSDLDSWLDKTDNNNDFTTKSGVVQSGVDTKNSLNVVTFINGALNANSGLAAFDFLHDGSEHHIFIVMRLDEANPVRLNGILQTSSGTGLGMYLLHDDDGGQNDVVQHYIFRNTGYSNPTVNNLSSNGFMSTQTWHLLEVDADVDNGTAAERSALILNNGTPVKNNASTQTPVAGNHNTALWLGFYATSTYNLDGKIAEVLIYEGAVSTDDRNTIVTYLQDKWAL